MSKIKEQIEIMYQIMNAADEMRLEMLTMLGSPNPDKWEDYVNASIDRYTESCEALYEFLIENEDSVVFMGINDFVSALECEE